MDIRSHLEHVQRLVIQVNDLFGSTRIVTHFLQYFFITDVRDIVQPFDWLTLSIYTSDAFMLGVHLKSAVLMKDHLPPAAVQFRLHLTWQLSRHWPVLSGRECHMAVTSLNHLHGSNLVAAPLDLYGNDRFQLLHLLS